MRRLLALALASCPTAALAEAPTPEAPAGALAGPAAEVPEAPAASPVQRPDSPNALARARDAAIDRGLLSTHAETIGKGQWAINAYELFFVGATYGFTDTIQASISTLMPIVTDMPFVVAAQPKFVVQRTENTVVAIRAPLFWLSDSDLSGGAGAFGAGVVMDHRFDPEGRYTLHGGLLVSGALLASSSLSDDIEVGDGAIISLDLGTSLAFTEGFSMLIEGQAFAAITNEGFDLVDAGLLSYGVRFHSGKIAGDIGFVRPLGVDAGDFLLGLPYLAFSARL
jgi:hypothetical protein